MQDLVPVGTQQLEFNWETKISETKDLIEQDRSLETQQVDIMLRRAEIRVKIGLNLLEMQSEHANSKSGDFTTIIVPELGISRSSAYDFMSVAKRFAGRFEDTFHDRGKYAWDVWRELARPSTPDVIIEQVEAKQIDATPQAIKEAKEALKRAEEAERQAREEAKLAQQQLFQVRAEGQNQVESLNRQIQDLQQQRYTIIEQHRQETQRLAQPSPKDTAEIERLSQKLDSLVEQRNKLNEKVNQLTYERDNESARADKLAQGLLHSLTEQKQDEHGEQVRENWRSFASEFQSTMMRWFSRLPTPLDTQSFDSDDWARLIQLQETANRFIGECQRLRQRSETMVVDAG